MRDVEGSPPEAPERDLIDLKARLNFGGIPLVLTYGWPVLFSNSNPSSTAGPPPATERTS